MHTARQGVVAAELSIRGHLLTLYNLCPRTSIRGCIYGAELYTAFVLGHDFLKVG